jgi:hypothetical protein
LARLLTRLAVHAIASVTVKDFFLLLFPAGERGLEAETIALSSALGPPH